jgi:uncharacterized protein YuzE
MKFYYYPETDSLYIDLAERPSADSREVAPGVVLDFDADGQLVGIDIDHASQSVNLSRIEAVSLPVTPGSSPSTVWEMKP